MIIQHNIQAAFASSVLDKTKNRISKETEKLSSGYKINRSSDDAAGLSISEKMRRQIRGLNQASRNIQDGISLVDTADGAMQEIHDMLQRQRELLVQAANDTNTIEDKEAIQKEIIALKSEIDDIFEKTEFNGKKIFKGSINYLVGPNYSSEINKDEKIINTTTTQNSGIKWIPKGDSLPAPVQEVKVDTTISTDFRETEDEWVVSVDEMGRKTYAYENKEIETITENNTTTTIEKEYKELDSSAMDPYINLKDPRNMVGSRGYLNFSNENGTLDLSCAMSQLGIKIDDTDTIMDLYNSSIKCDTSKDGTGKIVTTTYQFTNGIELSQEIILDEINGKYDIKYTVNNNSTDAHDIKVRLAFDAMNTNTAPDASINSPNDIYPIENDTAGITVGASSSPYLKKSAYGDISDMYGNWDATGLVDGKPVSYHTGVGYWWEEDALAAGSSMTFSVSYGPIELKVKPIEEITTTNTEGKIITTEKIKAESGEYIPTYLMIQSGANKDEAIAIRQYNLKAAGKPLYLDKISVYNTDNSLILMDKAVNKMSEIRSDYGAKRNRLGYAMGLDDTVAENTQAAESRIRDTDMAKGILQYSKENILQQAGEAILAQANQLMQGALSLLV